MMRTCLLLAALVLGAGAARETEDVWRATLPTTEAHPSLMFGPEDLPAIRERVTRPPYSDWWEGVRTSSDIISQAFTWRLTGDKEKAEAVRQHLLRCYPTGYHCCCGVADALQGIAEAYDLVADYEGITPQEHRVIRAKIARSCERLYQSALLSGPGQHPGNQRTRGLCALGTAAIVLRGYADSAHTPQQWLQRALDGIRDDANLSFWRDDGMFIEGPAYSAFTLSVMLPFARYYHRASGKWLFDDPRLRNALYYLIHVTQPDGEANAFGTTNMCGVVNYLRLCIGAGRPQDQAVYRWAIAQWGSLEGGGVRDIGLFDDRVQPSTTGLPTTRFFPVSQEASLRSDWSTKAVALWFKGKEPWLAKGYGVYSHGDVGSFILHAYGELLAVDAGYDHWVSYDLYPPELHNTLLVDGKGPVSGTPGLLENALDAGVLQAGEIRATYAGAAHRRVFLLVDGRYAVIADNIRSPKARRYDWQIHTPVSRGTGQVTLRGNRASWTGFDPRTDTPGKVRLEAVWAGPVRLAPMEKSRWQPWSSDPKTGSYDNWALVARQERANARYLTLLYPHPETQPAPPIETVAATGGRCLVLRAGATRDTFLVPEGPRARAGGLVTTAALGATRERAGRLEWAYLSGPGRLERDGKLVLALEGTAGAVALVPSAQEERLAVSGASGLRVVLPAGAARHAFLCAPGAAPRPLAMTVQGNQRVLSFPTAPPTGAVVRLRAAPARPVTDADPPRLVALAVDGRPAEAAAILDLGRVEAAPRQVQLRFQDRRPGLDRDSLRVQLDGLPLVPAAQLERDGSVALALGEVREQTDHELLVSVADQAALPNRAQFLLRFSLRPLLQNGGFEEGGQRPAAWSVGAWSSDAQTQYEIRTITENPRSGRRCLMLRGIAGHLNLAASQQVPLRQGQTYVLTGYYRGDVPAAASFCSRSGRGQYLWMPAVGPSATWIPFRWEFTVENPEAALLVAVRLGQPGVACFDDLALEEKR